MRDAYFSLLDNIPVLAPLLSQINAFADSMGVRDKADASPTVERFAALVVAANLTREDELASLNSQVEQARKPLQSLSYYLKFLARAAPSADGARKKTLQTLATDMLNSDPDGVSTLEARWRTLLGGGSPATQPPASGVRDELASTLDRATAEPAAPGVPPSPLITTYVVDEDLVDDVVAASMAAFEMKGEYIFAADEEAARVLGDANVPQVAGAAAPSTGSVLLVASTPQDERLSLVGTTNYNVEPDDHMELPPIPGENSADLLRKYREAETRFSVLAAAITVLGGMSALYFPAPTFGALGDYAGMFLWGTAVGKGADVVAKALASR